MANASAHLMEKGPRTMIDAAAFEQNQTSSEQSQLSSEQKRVSSEQNQTATNGPEEAAVFALPATEGQLRFWSLDQLHPGNPALNMPLMWRCTGRLNDAAMVEAFTACVERHEALRTTFKLIDGKLSQIIATPYPVELPIVDLELLAPSDRQERAAQVTRQHAAFPFDLAHGPLLQLKLIRLDRDHHVLLVTMHHIICDGISLGILLRDMAAFYDASITQNAPRLPELPIQFADFAVWQEEWLQSEDAERTLAFWRESIGDNFERLTLARDPDAVSSLPAEHADWTGDIETLLIPKDLQVRAHAFCKRENVTLNILLFTVFAALLRRLSNQLDLVIGSPCANRTEETEELIGLFMNIQVMRLRLTEDETFRTLLQKVQAWTLGAYEHQVLPFERVVHDPFYARGHNSFELPIFFLYQKSFMVTHHVGGLEIVPLRSESSGAVFEIFFAIVDRAEEGPRLQLEYNPRYFKVSTVHRYLKMYVNLLESALDEPACAVDTLEMLGADGRRQIALWNQTATLVPAFETVAATLLKRAAVKPHAIAVESAGTTWTNAELARYAQSVAADLLALGVHAGDRVGIAVDRSPQMLGALLAVMLAGAAYVPLDPRHPAERLEMVLRDSGATMLLCSEPLHLRTTAAAVIVPGAPPAEAQVPDVALPAAAAGDLAYVIYTSGTTGGPKGVAIEHGALNNLLHSVAREPGLKADDVLVAITTLAFDIAALELLLPLVTGARLIIATDAEVLDAKLLLTLIEQTGATVLEATPGAWRLLLDAGWAAPAPGKPALKALCGGEALPRELAERMLERTPDVWNMYGPTETTIWSSALRITSGKGTVPIGPPIANTTFYVLNHAHEPNPPGVAGELFIGGAGLARGYWNRPELTAEKFIANPFGAGRLYNTGDLARWRDDGTLELLGRADFQIKIRGYRIEPAEIESKLVEHPAVEEAVVIQQHSDSTGVTRLLACVAVGDLSAPGHETLLAELRTLLSATLPEYMLPTGYVLVDRLPRNTNGKIDRRALPLDTEITKDGIGNATDADFAAPADIIESQLQDIWQSTLGIPHISTQASFFSLGVGSLAALRLITKMNRIYAMDLGLASLISASTIVSIAELIRTRFAPNRDSALVPLKPEGKRPPLFILHGVGGNVVNFYGLAARMAPDQPVYGIQSQALVANQPALLHLTDMARHYLADIRKVQPSGPYHLLGYSFGGTVVLEMARQLRAAGSEVALIGMIDSRSKDYDNAMAGMRTVQDKVSHRVNRFRGNTGRLPWRDRLRYVREKLQTRAIRYACWAAAQLSFERVPTFMRSAYDINYIAIQMYKVRPYDGHLVLFRASEQDHPGGPYDLGWGPIFRQGVEIHDLPGDHERIFLEPNIESLANSLTECLTRVHA